MEQLTCCPHCGYIEYYTKDYICGSTRYFHRFDGKDRYNGEMYDHLDHNQGKWAYCVNCDKRLFKMEDAPCVQKKQAAIFSRVIHY